MGGSRSDNGGFNMKAIIKNKTILKSVFNPYKPGQIVDSGYPKILPATYTFMPLEIQIKERTENE